MNDKIIINKSLAPHSIRNPLLNFSRVNSKPNSYRQLRFKLLLLSILSISYGVQAETIVYDDAYNQPLVTCYTGNCLYPTTSTTGNTVIIDYTTNSLLNGVLGAYSVTGQDISGNSVILKQGIVDKTIYGGYTIGGQGESFNNHVTIDGGQVNSYAVGGIGRNAYHNSVTVNAGTVAVVIGGDGQWGNAYNNQVTINGGTISGGPNYVISGGLTIGAAGQSYNNTLDINGGTVIGDVYAGSADASANSYNNTLNLTGAPDLSAASLYGGNNGVNGNVLNFSAQPISVQNVGNFEHYNFTLQPSLANSNTALITANTITLGSGSTPSDIKVVGIHSGNTLTACDQFILMEGNTLSGNGQGISTKGVAQQGISLNYNVTTTVDNTSNQVIATIDGLHSNTSPATVNPQLKALSEGRLATEMLITRGADNIAYGLINVINDQNARNGFAPFIDVRMGSTRYNSGSHIDADEKLLTTGISYQQQNISTALIAEFGWGSYDSYNNFSRAAKVHGDGDNHYSGVGLLARYDFDSGMYTDASFRYERAKTKFKTNDIINFATGENAKYSATSNYVSSHFGIGYATKISDKTVLDVSTKYLWSHLNSKNVNVAGDRIKFDAIDSHRTRLNSELKYAYNQEVTLSTGLGVEYEFDSKAKATTYDIYDIKAPSIKGGTGIASIGVNYKPAKLTNLSLSADIQGYVGKREGGAIGLRVLYRF